MKIFIFVQFGPNLCLSCRKFYEDSKNNNLSTLRSILFELWRKNFQAPPWPFSQRRPCRAWKYWDLNFDDWKCLGRPFFISMAFFNSQRSLVLEIIGGAKWPPLGVMSNSEHPAWTGLTLSCLQYHIWYKGHLCGF